MATVDIDIVNLALVKLDVAILANLTGKSKAAQYASTTYDMLRDVVMGGAPWGFAMARAILPRSSDDLVWGADNTYKFAKPGDCLRIWRVYQQVRWQVEGDFVVVGSLNDEDNTRQWVGAPNSLKVRYIKKITSPGSYNPFFVEALATRLAMEWCVGLTGSDAKKQVLMTEYVSKMEDAKALDGQEGIPEDIHAVSWSDSRLD